MALQAQLEAQQRQNEMLKQSLQHNQPPQPSSSLRPSSMHITNTPAPVTASQITPTVITVGAGPRPRAPVAPAASTTYRTPLSHAAATPVPTRDVSRQQQLAAAGFVSSGGAMMRSQSPSRDKQRLNSPTDHSDGVDDTVTKPAVQVTTVVYKDVFIYPYTVQHKFDIRLTFAV